MYNYPVQIRRNNHGEIVLLNKETLETKTLDKVDDDYKHYIIDELDKRLREARSDAHAAQDNIPLAGVAGFILGVVLIVGVLAGAKENKPQPKLNLDKQENMCYNDEVK